MLRMTFNNKAKAAMEAAKSLPDVSALQGARRATEDADTSATPRRAPQRSRGFNPACLPDKVTLMSRAAPEASWRRITKCAQHNVDAGLVTGTLRLEPFNHVLVAPKAVDCSRRQGLQSAYHHAAHDVPHVGLGMPLGIGTLA
jgi:hypothetical protein